MSDIYNLILSHKPLDKNLFENIDVGRDGNCFYLTLSLFFTNEESHYKFFSGTNFYIIELQPTIKLKFT